MNHHVAPQFGYMYSPAHHNGADGSFATSYGEYACLPRYETNMPHRCIRCNGPAFGARLREKVSWYNPWIGVLFFAIGIFYLIVAYLAQKEATIEYSLCEKHWNRRIFGKRLALGGILGGVALLPLGLALDLPQLVGLCPLAILIGLPGLFIMRMMTVQSIDDHWAYYNVGKPFADSLPATRRW